MDTLTQEQKSLLSSINECFALIVTTTKNTAGLIAEAQWADTFHVLSRDSSWLKDKTFSPGRWAIGYQYLCALYWFLDKMKPKCVLDLGLGQSTRMIAQYAAANPEVRHIVVESSLEWIDFFKNSSLVLPLNTRIVHCKYGTETFKVVDGVRVYDNFLSALHGYKFDFVSIDAPLSGDMIEFGRVDTIKLIPDGLSSRYAILFDDTGRRPDNASFRALVDVLSANGFSTQIGCFQGLKLCSAVVSEDLQCLLSNASQRFDPSDSGWQRMYADMVIERGGLDMSSMAFARTQGDFEMTVAKQEIAKRDGWLAESLKKREALAKKNAELWVALEKTRADRDVKSRQVKEFRDSLQKTRADRDAKSLQVQEFRAACKSAKETVIQVRGQRDELARKLREITKVVM